jgi:hypothetical protein
MMPSPVYWTGGGYVAVATLPVALACVVSLASFILAVPAFAESIGKWKTPRGSIYVGDKPPTGSTKLGDIDLLDAATLDRVRKGAATASPSPTRRPPFSTPLGTHDVGTITVARMWREYGDIRVLVSYRNDTRATFTSVTIQCTARDGSREVGTNSRSFSEFEHGPVTPGFTGTLEIPIDLHGADATTADCEGSGTGKAK